MKRLFTLMSLLALASMVLTACGGGAATATQPPAATQAPAATEAPATNGGTLKIVSSLPMTGASLTQTQTIVNSEQLRLDQANSQACGGKYKLAYEAWDDASAALGKWDLQLRAPHAVRIMDEHLSAGESDFFGARIHHPGKRFFGRRFVEKNYDQLIRRRSFEGIAFDDRAKLGGRTDHGK